MINPQTSAVAARKSSAALVHGGTLLANHLILYNLNRSGNLRTTQKIKHGKTGCSGMQ